jgi:hypothetical protein
MNGAAGCGLRIGHKCGDARFAERHQNAFGSPACLRMAFASGRFLTLTGTGNVRPVIGLHQIS